LIYNESKTEAVPEEEEQTSCRWDRGARLIVAGIMGPSWLLPGPWGQAGCAGTMGPRGKST